MTHTPSEPTNVRDHRPDCRAGVARAVGGTTDAEPFDVGAGDWEFAESGTAARMS